MRGQLEVSAAIGADLGAAWRDHGARTSSDVHADDAGTVAMPGSSCGSLREVR